ncbi:MAG: hypothetical protein R2827_15780 [Bdellovibrionales bacterium]
MSFIAIHIGGCYKLKMLIFDRFLKSKRPEKSVSGETFSTEFPEFCIVDNPEVAKFEKRIPLLFDSDRLKSDRFPFVNGFRKVLLTDDIFIKRDVNAEGYFGLFGPRFLRIFEPRVSVKRDEPFYYPIIITLSHLDKVIDKIEIPKSTLKKIISGQGKILLVCPYEGWTWAYWQKLADALIEKYKIPNEHIIVLSGNYAEPRPNFPAIGFNVWEYFRQFDGHFNDDRAPIIQQIKERQPRKHRFICMSRRPTADRYGITTELFPLEIKEF